MSVMFNVSHWLDYKKHIRRWYTRTWRHSILLPILHLTPRMDGFPWDYLCKTLHRGQRMGKVQNGEEIVHKIAAPE